MSIAALLEADGLRCIEPSFAELAEEHFTRMLVEMEADAARLLIDEEEEPIALALHGAGGWMVGSFTFRPVTLDVIQKMEDVGGDIYQEPRERWIAALREFYSRLLMEEEEPAVEDTREERPQLLRALLEEVWGDGSGGPCIDCCCGSGIGSMVLREMGIPTLAYDNDAALLSLGLSTGRLRPEETMWIDAAMASAYMDPVDRGAGFMLGDIVPYQASMWEAIVHELLALSRDTLITVATEPEVRMVEEWCTQRGRTVTIFENDRDPIYDRWVCRALRE